MSYFLIGDVDINDHLLLFEYIATFFTESFAELSATSYQKGEISTENPLKEVARNELETGVFLINIRVMVLRILLFKVKLGKSWTSIIKHCNYICLVIFYTKKYVIAICFFHCFYVLDFEKNPLRPRKNALVEDTIFQKLLNAMRAYNIR